MITKPTAVEQTAAFATAARPEHLSAETRALLKRNILDTLGCAMGALPGQPFAKLRAQFEAFRAPGRCTLIGGGKTSLDQATLYNAGLMRYVDLMDSFMGSGGLCHPSENLRGVLATAEVVAASGDEFIAALAVAYEVSCRFIAAVPTMSKGFNHALQLALSLPASCGRLMRLAPEQIAHAIAISAADNVSLAAIHSEPVSQWKGFSSAITAMRAVYTTGLAAHGFTGPLRLFEGPNGLERMFGQAIEIDWANPWLEAVRKTIVKKYSCLIFGQPVLEALLDLKRRHGLTASEVAHVTCETVQGGFDIAGGGAFGPKDHPTTKEQADYNLRYLIAVALLDDQVGPSQMDETRVNAEDTQSLLARVTIHPDPALTAAYPDHLGCRLAVHTHDGRNLTAAQSGYEGSLDRPFTWSRTVEKFHWLAEPYADGGLRHEIIGWVEDLEHRPVTELTSLLAQVRPAATYPVTLSGIQ